MRGFPRKGSDHAYKTQKVLKEGMLEKGMFWV